jgi:glycosyltransferase involved in cell wall biosynthesis
VASAAVVIAGDAGAAAAVVARADRAAGQRVIAIDGGLGQGLAALDGVEVRGHAPGRVDAYVAAGVPLGRVTWRPYPVGPALRDAPYSTQGPVVALGDTADWAQLARELAGREGLPPVHVIVSSGVDVPESPRWRVHRDLDEATIADAIVASRAVLFPARRVGKDATAAHARDLKWVAFAQSCGRPVVANRAMGVEDLVRHEVTGLAPARGEAMSSIAETLHRLCGDEPKLRRLSSGALRVHAAGAVDAWADELVKGASWAGGAATAGRPFPTW